MEKAKFLYLMGVDARRFEPLTVSDISLPDAAVDHVVNNGLKEFFVLRILTRGKFYGEDHVKVHKSKFVCRACMSVLQQDKVLIMTKCDCKYILMHTDCEIEWFKNIGNCKHCDACKQEIQNIHVFLSETIEDLSQSFEPTSLRPPSMIQSSRVEMEQDKFLIVKVKTPNQTNVVGEQDEKIHKLEAICKVCFNLLKENSADVLIKTKCRCNFTLMHENCAIECSEDKGNNMCELCEEDFQSIPVYLSSPNITGSAVESIMTRISRLLKGFGRA